MLHNRSHCLQVLAVTPFTCAPITVQVEVVRLLNETGRPDEAVALTVTTPFTVKPGQDILKSAVHNVLIIIS